MTIGNVKGVSSIRTFTFGDVNIITGPGFSGKSTIMEVMFVLRELARGRNPFSIFWGAKNFINDSSKPARISIEMDIHGSLVSYDLEFQSLGYNYVILKERVVIGDLVEVQRDGDRIDIVHRSDFSQKIEGFLDSCRHLIKEKLSVNKNTISINFPLADRALVGLFRESVACIFEDYAVAVYDNRIPIVSPIVNDKILVADIIESFYRFLTRSNIVLYVDPIRVMEPGRVERSSLLNEGASYLFTTLLNVTLEDYRTIEEMDKFLREIMKHSAKIKLILTDDQRVSLRIVIDNKELAPPVLPRSLIVSIAYLTAILSSRGFVAIDDVDSYLDKDTLIRLIRIAKKKGIQTFLVIRNEDLAKSLSQLTNAKAISL